MHYGSEYLRELGESLEAVLTGYRLDFAIALERAMDRHGVRKAELARRLDSSAAYVTKLLRGDANCTIDTMGRAAHALGEGIVIDVRPVDGAPAASTGQVSVDVQAAHSQRGPRLWLVHDAEAPITSRRATQASDSREHVHATAA